MINEVSMEITSITSAQLHAVAPRLGAERLAEFLPHINAVLITREINTTRRVAMFLAQCAHESNGFATLEENLNYGAAGLSATWPRRFPSDVAASYARKPEAIANRAYADRMGNGNEASGDGWNYRGRGIIQITGRENYQKAGNALGMDFIASPGLLTLPEWAVKTAGWYWAVRRINTAADAGSVERATKLINGGTNGLNDRQNRYQSALAALTA